jgi:hypothetical protein
MYGEAVPPPVRVLLSLLLGAIVLVGCGGNDGAGADPVEVLRVVEDVEYYGACGDETLIVDGSSFYPLLPDEVDALDQDRYPTSAVVTEPEEGLGRTVLLVAPPGPGDDIGLLLVYADGMARFKSESGWIIWLTTEPRTYNWVC